MQGTISGLVASYGYVVLFFLLGLESLGIPLPGGAAASRCCAPGPRCSRERPTCGTAPSCSTTRSAPYAGSVTRRAPDAYRHPPLTGLLSVRNPDATPSL